MRTTSLRTVIATLALAFIVALSIGSIGPTEADATVSDGLESSSTTSTYGYDQCVTRRECSLAPDGRWRCRYVTYCRTVG